MFGALGGTISGIHSIKNSYLAGADIPEGVLNTWLTLARPVIGLAAALAITVFVLGGLVNIGEITVGIYLIFAVAFASGFSEKIIIGAVGKATPSSS